MAQLPKGGLVRGHDKPIHGSCAIYFPGGVTPLITSFHWRPSCSDVGPMMGVTLTPKMTMAKSLIVKLRKLHLLVMLPFSIANFYDYLS